MRLLLMLLLTCGLLPAEEPAPPLAKVHLFAFGGIGIGGDRTQSGGIRGRSELKELIARMRQGRLQAPESVFPDPEA